MFRKKTQRTLPTEPTNYPAGVCVKTASGRWFIGRDGKRYLIQSDAIFNSWSFPCVVETTDSAIKHIPVAVSRLGFRDGTLVSSVYDGSTFLVSAGRLRPVVDVGALSSLGLERKDAMIVSTKDIKIMKVGEELDG